MAPDDEIDPMDCLRVVWSHRWLMAVVVAAGVMGTALASLIMTPVYESRAVIVPAGALSKDQGAATGFLAMQFGFVPPVTPASVEIVNLLKSNNLRERLIRRHGLLPLFFTKESMRGKTENQLMWDGMRYLEKRTTVNFAQKDNLITLSCRYKDPGKARELVASMLTELNDYMSGEAKRVADMNRKYLEAQVEKTSDPFIKAKIYTLIAQHIETSVMAEAKENFAFKVLDPPRVPDKRISPKRMLMVLAMFVVSLFVGIFAVFLIEYAAKTGRKAEGSRE
jgi:uncharacterized protein involved in exopolysaccharide biosynthesis